MKLRAHAGILVRHPAHINGELDKMQILPRLIRILGDSVTVDRAMAQSSLVVILFDGRLRMPAAGRAL